MKIKITNEILDFLNNLDDKTYKQKTKIISKIFLNNDEVKPIFNSNLDDAIDYNSQVLYNIKNGIFNHAKLIDGIEIDFKAKPINKKLNIFKRFIRLFNKNAFKEEYDRLNRSNEEYNSYIEEAREVLLDNENAAFKDEEEIKNIEVNVNLNEEKIEIEQEKTNENILNIENEKVNQNDFLTEEEKADLEYAKKLEMELNGNNDLSKDEELARKLQQEEGNFDEVTKRLAQEKADYEFARQMQNGINNGAPRNRDLGYIKHFSKYEKLNLLKGLNLVNTNFDKAYIDGRIMDENITINEIDNLIDDLMKDNHEELKSIIKAFNYPKINKDVDDPVKYGNDLLNRKTNLEINERTAEVITLASFNYDELTNVLNYVKNNPKLDYLIKPLNYKLINLSDKTMDNIEFNNNFINIPNDARFALFNNEGNFSQIIPTLAAGISSADAINNKEEYLNAERKNALENIKKISKNPSMEEKKELLTIGEDKMLINLGESPRQTTNNGCWSCSISSLLKYQGINLDQKDIRLFRPSCESIYDMPNLSLTRLRNRISFSLRAEKDLVNTALDYTDLIHKTCKNALVHDLDVDLSKKGFKETITTLMNKYKTPISFVDGIHYRTILGYDGDYVIYHDSLAVPPRYSNDIISSGMPNKYPGYSICKFDKFTSVNKRCELTWIERNVADYELKDKLNGFSERAKASVSAASVLMSKTDELGEEIISVPFELSTTLAIGPFKGENIVVEEDFNMLNDEDNYYEEENEEINLSNINDEEVEDDFNLIKN